MAVDYSQLQAGRLNSEQARNLAELVTTYMTIAPQTNGKYDLTGLANLIKRDGLQAGVDWAKSAGADFRINRGQVKTPYPVAKDLVDRLYKDANFKSVSHYQGWLNSAQGLTPEELIEKWNNAAHTNPTTARSKITPEEIQGFTARAEEELPKVIQSDLNNFIQSANKIYQGYDLTPNYGPETDAKKLVAERLNQAGYKASQTDIDRWTLVAERYGAGAAIAQLDRALALRNLDKAIPRFAQEQGFEGVKLTGQLPSTYVGSSLYKDMNYAGTMGNPLLQQPQSQEALVPLSQVPATSVNPLVGTGSTTTSGIPIQGVPTPTLPQTSAPTNIPIQGAVVPQMPTDRFIQSNLGTSVPSPVTAGGVVALPPEEQPQRPSIFSNMPVPQPLVGTIGGQPLLQPQQPQPQQPQPQQTTEEFIQQQQPPVQMAKGGEVTDDEFIQEMLIGTRPEDFPETSPVDTAVSDFISSRSKLVTDPQEFFRVMGENIEEYHGKPLREDPEKYLMEQLGPGVLGGIIKPKGGNVITQDLMESLKNLRPSVQYEGYRPASDADKLIREQMKREEESGRGVSAVTRRIFEENKPKAALDDWIQNKLGRYIRTEMGSEDDPVRKLGEEMTEKIRSAYEAGFKRIAKMKDKIAEAKAMGKNTDISEAELADEINRVENAYRQTSKLPVDQGPYLYPRSRTGRAREKAGFSPYPISKSDAGKEWEGTADALFEVHKAGDLVKQNSPLLLDNPWIAKLDPKEIVYQPKNVDEPAMFTHTIDELENALNPNSGLPENLLLKPEDMQQLSIEKAFRHVNKINDWRMQQRTAANLEEAQRAAVTYKEYPGSTGKLKWQELKAPEYTELPPGYRLEDMDYGTAMLKDAQGNILTYIDKMGDKGAVDPLKQALSFLSRNDLERALKYEGSTMRHCVGKYCDPVFLGQTRVFSLRDSKGEPHITIETAPPRTTTETINQFFKENPSLKRAEGLDDFQYANSPAFPWNEYNQWLKSQPEEVRQVKGKGNDKPSARYIEFGQDFIASKNWSDINDLENLDIIPLKPMLLKNAQDRGFNPQIITTVGDQPYVTKEEFKRLGELLSGKNRFAAGGEITKFIKDNR